ncbi:hypothetical protein M427DRAFT_30888 [Gonapodya prolifera JEL478]|uniref:Uncharacterized protein n=1 Tax=Gonapodya prolifera (strain JEL478) TaxID=1344416 RepID=A0A139AIX4_GONPJ|nr:hypothetical protein M427DRAFT_30888 [Gonapodya prolifera JEL478]|eukprot:KXS16761.1 hypothetical protein M427DRAFT_30888 [Gonapodya prolifera JEL478]
MLAFSSPPQVDAMACSPACAALPPLPLPRNPASVCTSVPEILERILSYLDRCSTMLRGDYARVSKAWYAPATRLRWRSLSVSHLSVTHRGGVPAAVRLAHRLKPNTLSLVRPTSISLNLPHVQDENVHLLSSFFSLVSHSARSWTICDAHPRIISSLTASLQGNVVTSLSVSMSRDGDEGLAVDNVLPNLQNLTFLEIREARETLTLAAIPTLRHLRRLRLFVNTDTWLSTAVYRSIGACSNLASLSLLLDYRDSDAQDVLTHLRGLTSLESLEIEMLPHEQEYMSLARHIRPALSTVEGPSWPSLQRLTLTWVDCRECSLGSTLRGLFPGLSKLVIKNGGRNDPVGDVGDLYLTCPGLVSVAITESAWVPSVIDRLRLDTLWRRPGSTGLDVEVGVDELVTNDS